MKESTIRKAFIQTLNRESLMQYIPSGCTQANDIIPPDMTFMGTNYRTEAGGNFYLKQDDSAVQSINTVLSEQRLTKMPSITILCLDDPTVKQMVNEMIATWNEAFGNYFNLNWNKEFPAETILLRYVLYDLPVTPLLVYYRYFSQTVIIIPQI